MEEVKKRVEEIFQSALGIDPGDQAELQHWRDRSSVDVVLVTVQIEKAFGIRFHLSDLTSESFASLEGITKLVLEKTRAKRN